MNKQIDTSKNSLITGIIFVILGASSYGMLSTFVKMAYSKGFTTAEVTIAQFGWGLLILSLLSLFQRNKSDKLNTSDVSQLFLAGIPLGCTSVLYYIAVKYIDASIAVVFLMQSVWIGVLAESIITRKFPSLEKIIAIILVLIGTLLATNSLGMEKLNLDIRGVIFGMLSAISFSCTFFATSKVATHLPPIKRSQLMLCGGGAIVLIFSLLTQIGPYYFDISLVGNDFIQNQAFNFNILFSYGFLVALFGTIIPPIMLNKGFPQTGVGIGSIVASIELPFAMTIAFVFLNESVNFKQWIGVVLIIAAIVLLNYKMINFSKK